MTPCHISTLALVRFRSYSAARLDLTGGPVVLYGPNGSGKTSILEAVSLFSPGRGIRRATPEEISCQRFEPGWKLSAELVAGDRRLGVETIYRGTSGRRVEIEGKPVRQSELASMLRIVWVAPAMDRLWTDGREGRKRFLDRMVMNFFPAHAEDVIAYEKAMRERNRLLKDRQFDHGWLLGLELQMAERGVAITRSRISTVARLEQAARQSAGEFPVARLSLVAPDETRARSTDQDELVDALTRSRFRDASAGRTLIGSHRVDLLAVHDRRLMEAGNCSTGEQKALLLSIVLANCRAIAEDCGEPPILLLDEITAHLDVVRRRALFGEIRQLGTQAWLTGTQADLFDDLGGGAQWFDVSDQAGESSIVERSR